MRYEDANLYMIISARHNAPVNIPTYQRDITWDENKCLMLINDIEDMIKKGRKSHYLGQMYFKEYNDYKNLVDGQQRITMIGLLMIAVINAAEDLRKRKLHSEYPYDDEEYDEIIEEARKYLFDEKGKIHIKLHKRDMKILSTLATVPYERARISLKENEKEELIYTNYNVFKNFAESWAAGAESLMVLAKIPERLKICYTKIDDEEEEMEIYKRINSTGLKMQDVDLIRNFLFLPFDKDEDEQICKNYWEKIEENIKHNSKNGNMRKFMIAVLPLITNMSSQMKIGKDKSLRLYNLYEKHYQETNTDDTNKIKSEKLLQQMLYYSNLYKELLFDKNFFMEKAPLYRQKIYELRKIAGCVNADSIQLYLLELLLKDKITEQEYADAIWPLIVYNIRSKVSEYQNGLTIEAGQNIMINIRIKMERNPKLNIAEYIWQELTKDAENRTKKHILSKNDFKKFLKEIPFKEKFGISNEKPASKYLIYIANQYKNNNKKLIPFETSHLGLHCIIPIEENERWMRDLHIRGWERAKKYNLRIGNYFIDQTEQSGIEKRSWADKKKYMEDSRFPITKAMSDEQVWTLETVEKYTEELAEIITNHYSGPEKYEKCIADIATDTE